MDSAPRSGVEFGGARPAMVWFGEPQGLSWSGPFVAEGMRFAWEPAEPVLPPGVDLRSLNDFSVTVTTRLDHAVAVRIAKAFGIPYGLVGAQACTCHPLPFPAARDYRRRTKGRRRRARR